MSNHSRLEYTKRREGESDYALERRIRDERNGQRDRVRTIEARIDLMRRSEGVAPGSIRVAQLALRAARLRLWSMPGGPHR